MDDHRRGTLGLRPAVGRLIDDLVGAGDDVGKGITAIGRRLRGVEYVPSVSVKFHRSTGEIRISRFLLSDRR